MCYCCQCHVLLGNLVMTAANSVTAEVDHHIVALLMADVQMGCAAMVGLNHPIVRLVCTNSGLV